jgi:hypothetical protein
MKTKLMAMFLALGAVFGAYGANVRVYVSAPSSVAWGDSWFCYAWDSGPLLGTWPGTQAVETETLDGVTWHYLDVSVNGDFGLIVGDGSGKQTGDFAVTGVSDGKAYFIEVAKSGGYYSCQIVNVGVVQIPTYAVSGLPTTNATVTVDGVATNVPASGEISVAEGAAVKVTPSAGYQFESFTAAAVEPPVTDLSTLTGDHVAQDGETLTGTLGGNYKISIADGATVTLKDVTINGIDDENCKWAGITCEGDATIILKGDNNIQGFHKNYSGIYVPENKTLVIEGTGSLTARSNAFGAGIGACQNISCGNICIKDGTINATGTGNAAAGIGGAWFGSCGSITVSGGTVNATGGDNAAGIGAGYKNSHCTEILIVGGIVAATGGQHAPGIGAGGDASHGNITIADTVTKVTATKGAAGAAYSIGIADDVWAAYPRGTITVGGVATGDIATSPYVYENATKEWTSGDCTVTLNAAGTLAVSGNGAMANYDYIHALPWYGFLDTIRNVVVESGVTIIGNVAFGGCTALTSITIPDSVIRIGDAAFYECTGLVSATIGKGVISIGSQAFYNCTAMTDVYCYPNAEDLDSWGNASHDFKSDRSTLIHVKGEQLAAYQSRFGSGVRATFAGDLIFEATANADGSYSFTVPASDVVVTQVLGLVPEITAVINAIDAIGTVEPTAECKAKIDAARAAYDALTDEQKALVTNYDKLTAAEAQWLDATPLTVWRFYSKKYRGHFFTIDEEEKQNLIDTNPNWKFEGGAYKAYTNQAPGTVPLYRFYSKKYSGHFFTIDEEEMETVRDTNPNWKYEGIAYYVYPEEVGGTVPVFRFWSKGYKHHFYTIDEEEKDTLIATNPNWAYERVAFYALPLPAEGAKGTAKAGKEAAGPVKLEGLEQLGGGEAEPGKEAAPQAGRLRPGTGVAVTTSDGSDGAAVADGDETTAWSPEEAGASWVVLSFADVREVADVEVAGENLPEGTRILISEDADEWTEEVPGVARYVWVAFPAAEEAPLVREIRVTEE